MGITKDSRAIKDRLAGRLFKGAKILENEMIRLVAIKTGELVSDIGTDPISFEGSLIKTAVGTENVDYARFVDLPVKNQERKYHRFGVEVFRGKGQRYRARALDNKRDEIMSVLRSG